MPTQWFLVEIELREDAHLFDDLGPQVWRALTSVLWEDIDGTEDLHEGNVANIVVYSDDT